MPQGPLKIAADQTNEGLLDQIRSLVDCEPGERLDALVCAGVPEIPATHVVLTGSIDDALDAWDLQAPAQSLGGALWVGSSQESAPTIAAWVALRVQTPTTPLSDLTDSNQRALRWSVAAGAHVQRHHAGTAEVSEDEIRAWLDEQPEVRELGQSIERLNADTADATLEAAQRFRGAIAELDSLASLPVVGSSASFDAALAEQLRVVQLSGLRRWRAGKARAQSCKATVSSARELAADRLRQLIEARRVEMTQQRQQDVTDSATQEWVHEVAGALDALTLPVEPSFEKSPRSWTDQATVPRRYILVNPAQAGLFESSDIQVRELDSVRQDSALCLLVQSGFSLPALR